MSPVLSPDAAAFGELEPFRRQLTAYCYRMLASPHDAEDAVQESFIRAWRGLSRFEDRTGLRPWLYRIATNVCLDMLKGRSRRALPSSLAPAAGRKGWGTSHEVVMGMPRPEATWVQPVPDNLVISLEADPADVVVERESIRLAFIAAMQDLQPRQRVVLILCDVLRWKAKEVAELLDTSTDAVNSTLRRARMGMDQTKIEAIPTQAREIDLELLARYVEAFEDYNVHALTALLHDDATLTMPPFELWLKGIDDIALFLAAMQSEGGRYRTVTLAANGCPALAVYRTNHESGELMAFAIHVLECSGGRIAAIHAFLDPEMFAMFGLPSVFAG